MKFGGVIRTDPKL